jgi:hypothetical protein
MTWRLARQIWMAIVVAGLAASPVLAQEGSTPKGGWVELLVNGAPGLALLILSVTGVAPWLAGKAYEQFSDAWKVRRTFVVETTKSVSGFATTHYWALANAAGTLSGALDQYLRMTRAYCFLNYATATQLSDRLDDLAREAAKVSFPALARLVIRFDRFQFHGSNTYLLPHHTSGETLRRLYNAFVASADQRLLTLIRQGVENHLAAEAKPEATDPFGLYGTFLEGLPDQNDPEEKHPEEKHPEEKHPEEKHKELSEARAIWQKWLRNSLPDVNEAADALRAYSEILSHELALLNAVFFQDRPGVLRNFVRASGIADRRPWRPLVAIWARENWPMLVSARTVAAAARSSALSRDFAPLGGSSPAKPRTAPPSRPARSVPSDVPPRPAQ